MFHYLHAYLCVHFFDIIVQFICIYCLLKSEIYLHDITIFNFYGDKQETNTNLNHVLEKILFLKINQVKINFIIYR